MDPSAPTVRFTLPRSRWVFRPALIVLGVLALLGTTAAGLLLGIAASIAGRLPDVTTLSAPPPEATRIYARDGQLVASLYRENRVFVSLDRIPLALQQAVLAIEDDRFYRHHGVDLRGTLRALWRNLLARDIVEGGSTVTQQVARIVFLSPERLVSRKLAEMLLAVEIERRFTKAEILERYLNQVYFGHGAYGVEMAARVFFGKPVEELRLPEAALLAGLIRAPSVSSPYRNLEKVRARQRLVLERMADLGYISEAAAQQAAAEPLGLTQERNAGLIGIRAPYFVAYILPYLLERYGEEAVYRGGLQVHTTLDIDLQAAAEKAVRRGIDAAQQSRLNVTQGALVALEPQTGAIRAMIGGYAFEASQFNRAWQARRPPGSAFKPFVYVAAIASGMSPSTVIVDEPIEYETPEGLWQPKNYTEEFAGPVRMRQAIERSINIPAIKTLEQLGPGRVIALAQRMGITSPLRPDLSLALGSSEVTLLELTSAYGVLGAQGVRADPVAILRVLDQSGRVLEERVPRRQVVLSPEVAHVMIDVLKGVITRGTGRGADLGRPVAGKTGTTDDYRNAWFLGFTPHLIAGVWVGNDDNSAMERVVGATVPTQIWRAFMEVAAQALPEADWEVPAGVSVVTVCGTSGLRATLGCDDPRREAFISGTEPTEYLLVESSEVRLNRTRTWRRASSDSAESPGGAGGAGADDASANDPDQPLPLSVTAPAAGQILPTPLVIEGITIPGAKVVIVIAAEAPGGPVEIASVSVGAKRDGTFAHTFWQPLPSSARYAITVTAHVRGREPASATLTLEAPPHPDGRESTP